MKNKKIKFVICDSTDNSFKPYISEDLSNTGDSSSAWKFDTIAEAQKTIDNAGWDWAYVQDI